MEMLKQYRFAKAKKPKLLSTEDEAAQEEAIKYSVLQGQKEFKRRVLERTSGGR